jgi:hypothetical protein
LDHRDIEAFEQIARPDTAELENLRRVNPASRQDDFLLGGYRDLPRRIASAVHLDPFGLWLFNLDPAHITVDEEMQIRPVLDGIVVGPACRTPRLVLAVGADWPPSDANQIAVHATVVEEREAHVFGPGSIQVVYRR